MPHTAAASSSALLLLPLSSCLLGGRGGSGARAADAERDRRLRLLPRAAATAAAVEGAAHAPPLPLPPPLGVLGRELAAEGWHQVDWPERCCCCWYCSGEPGCELAASRDSSAPLTLPSSMKPFMLSTSAQEGGGKATEEQVVGHEITHFIRLHWARLAGS